MKTAICFVVICLSICRSASCDEFDDKVDGNVVRSASRLLVEQHLRQDIDRQQLSREWARRYMLTLDPLSMYFLASDADELMKQAHLLLPRAERGKIDFPLLVARRFRARLDATTLAISRLLEHEHDFTTDESVTIDHQEFAAGAVDRDERWRLRIKHELLMENPSAPNATSSREFLRARYSRIQNHFHSLPPSKLLSLYIDALAKTLDPHSAYFDEPYLVTYRTSHIPNYTLGLRLAHRRGDLWVLPSPGETSSELSQLAGWRVVAIREAGQDPIHLTGLTYGTAMRTIISPVAELGHARSTLLDVDNPRTGERKVVACERWLPGR